MEQVDQSISANRVVDFGKSLTLLAAWLALGGLAVALIWHAWYGQDIWYHLFLGKRIIETHTSQPKDLLFLTQNGNFNIYPLFQLLCFSLYQIAGVEGVSAVFLVAWITIFLLWLSVVGVPKNSIWALPLFLGALLACQQRFDQRPEVFSYLFLVLELVLLKKTWQKNQALSWKEMGVFWLIQVLWVNVHGYFCLGIGLAGLNWLCAFFPYRIWGGGAAEEDRRKCENSARILLIGVLAASFCSPLGWQTWVYVIGAFEFLQKASSHVQEFAPPVGFFLRRFWTLWIFWGFWVATAIGVYLLVAKRVPPLISLSKRIFLVVLAGVGLYFSASSIRNVPLLFFFSAPLFCTFYEFGKEKEGIKDWLKNPPLRFKMLVSLGVTVIAASLAGWTIQGGAFRSLLTGAPFGVSLFERAAPFRFGEYLKKTGFAGSVFNGVGGGYLEFHFPKLRLFADTRFTDFEAVESYFQALADPQAFQILDQKFHFDSVFLQITENSSLIEALIREGPWKLVYADLHSAFLIHPGRVEIQPDMIWSPSFYADQDLTSDANVAAVIQWLILYSKLEDRTKFSEVLKQVSRAPRISSSIIRFAFMYAFQKGDIEVRALAISLMEKRSGPTKEAEDSLIPIAANG